MNKEQTYKLMEKLYGALTHVQVINEEMVPKEGPVIITLNHMSRIDVPALVMLKRMRDITPLAANNYRDFPVLGWMIRGADIIWIDRSKADFAAIKQALNVLKEGRILALAPEGTRSRTGQLIQAKEGVVMIASKANAKICPLSITGTEHFMSDFLHFRKPKITMRFGPCFDLPPIDRDNREASLRAATDEVMCHIAAMLPEAYRGFYKDFPRVAELQDEWRREGTLSLPEG